MVAEREAQRRLRTHADRPVSTAGEDEFGFVAYADAFALLINDTDTATPLTVAISGPWGAGKTSLAKLLETRLKVEQYWRLGWEKPPVTCWFNAWLHRDADHLGAAFAASVTRDLGRQRTPWRRWINPLPSSLISAREYVWRRVWRGVVAAGLVLVGLVVALSAMPELRAAQGPVGALLDEQSPLAVWAAVPAVVAVLRSVFKVTDSVGAFVDTPHSAATHGSLAEVRDQVGRLMRQAQRRRWRSNRARRRVVIFVDDLERCPAENALDMCEAANHLFGHDDVIIVLVADLDLVESAASVRYEPRDSYSSWQDTAGGGQEYLHKMIQLRFNLPPLPTQDVAFALGLLDRPVHANQSQPPRIRLARYIAWRDRLAQYSAPIGRLFRLILRGLDTVLRTGLLILVTGGAIVMLTFLTDALDHLPDSILIRALAAVAILFAGFSTTVVLILNIQDLASARRRRKLEKRVSAIQGEKIPSHSSLAEVIPSAQRNEADLRVANYAFHRSQAERGLAGSLPANPRRAKRLVNHHRLLATIAEDRNVFGGNPRLTHRHLAKWVLIVEHWPRLGDLLTRNPSMIHELEDSDLTDLRHRLQKVVPDAGDTNELQKILAGHPRLSPILERLVRFESSSMNAGLR